jgi:iron only hydrogenase large subunit-like protein
MAGMAGGQTEALIRNYHYRFTGKQLNNNRLRRFRINRPYREMELEIEGRSIHVGSVSGLSNAVEVLHQLESGKLSLDYLEVMACPSGCVNGGGHPYPVTEQTTRNRIRFLQEVLMHNGFTPFQKNGGFKKFVSTSRGLAAK